VSIDRSLYRPTLEEFMALAKEYTIVPVWREVLGDLETPVSALQKLGKGRNYFLLESAEHGERWSRYSFLGVDPFLVLRMKGDEIAWDGAPPAWATGDTPLDVVRNTVEGFRAPALDGLPPLHGGAVGYLGYDIVRHIEQLPDTTTDDMGVPDVLLQFTDRLVAFDHFRQVLSVIANVVPGDNPEAAYEDAMRRCEELVARLAQPVQVDPMPPPPVVRQEPPASTISIERWREMIEAAREYIFAGDIFQVVLSQRFEITGLRASPVEIYRMLRLVNPSPYMYILRFGDLWVVGSSPEALVRVEGREAITHPIAGTRWRGLTPEKDRDMELELQADPKERAEHVMLVDLARNDLGRVCEYGSVQCTKLFAIERFSHLMHLVSHVTGKLREGVTSFDVLRATFPAGTVSGAPKVRAMEIIDELEPTRRGLYAGVVGYFDFSGNLDTAIALRTALISGDTAYVQAGGGIVADAVADDEYQECVNKASALINAIRAAEQLKD
jgi:anthranilate synthase component 1